MKKTLCLFLALLLCLAATGAGATCACTAKHCACPTCKTCGKYVCNCVNEKNCACSLCRLPTNRCTCNLNQEQTKSDDADDSTIVNVGLITHQVGAKAPSWENLPASQAACEALCPQTVTYFSTLEGFDYNGVVLAKDPSHRYLVIFGDEAATNAKIVAPTQVISEAEALGADRIALVHHETLRYLSVHAAKNKKSPNLLTATLGYTNNLDILTPEEINAAHTGK